MEYHCDASKRNRMQTYRIISDDGKEVRLSVVEKSQYPYQEIAKLAAINKMWHYKVERINGNRQDLQKTT